MDYKFPGGTNRVAACLIKIETVKNPQKTSGIICLPPSDAHASGSGP